MTDRCKQHKNVNPLFNCGECNEKDKAVCPNFVPCEVPLQEVDGIPTIDVTGCDTQAIDTAIEATSNALKAE